MQQHLLAAALLFAATVDASTLQRRASIREDKMPVWVWWDYPEGEAMSGIVNATLASWKMHASEEQFEFRFVNASTVKQWLPSLPEEFDRLPCAQAASDLLRAGLLAEHGGLYMDTDILLRLDLQHLMQKLIDGSVDVVTYENDDQSCASGTFSSNFLSGSKGNAFHKAWYEEALRQLKTPCPMALESETQGMQDLHDSRRGVCCYTPAGHPRTCNVPWGGLGEHIGHPTLRAVLAEKKRNGFKGLHCFRGDKSFSNCKSQDCLWESAARAGDTIAWLLKAPAYHLFSTIAKASPSFDELTQGTWIISELVRGSLNLTAAA